jgi:hypothetical protein
MSELNIRGNNFSEWIPGDRSETTRQVSEGWHFWTREDQAKTAHTPSFTD